MKIKKNYLAVFIICLFLTSSSAFCDEDSKIYIFGGLGEPTEKLLAIKKQPMEKINNLLIINTKDKIKTFNNLIECENLLFARLLCVIENLQNRFEPGYKAETVQFPDCYNEALADGGAKQKIRGITFSQGRITPTNNERNLAINGNGFFVVSDVADSSKCSYTRDGRFGVNIEGLFIHSSGKRLMGYKLDENGSPTGEIVPVSLGKLELDSKLYGGRFASFKFNNSGCLYGQVIEVNPKTKQKTVTNVPIYLVAVASFANSSGLARVGKTTFSPTNNSGKAVFGVSGQEMLGEIVPQSLELSNVDIIVEKTNYSSAFLEYKMIGKILNNLNGSFFLKDLPELK